MYYKYFEGMIEVITGPMFSGKSDELIKRIRILNYANIKTLIIKPKLDNRFSDEYIVSRNGDQIKTFSVKNVDEIKKLNNDSYKAIAIDEAQFFEEDLILFLVEQANKGKRIIVSGLDQNYLAEPFGIIPKLLAIAENITKLKAICLVCKSAATCTFRKIKNDKEIVIGNDEEYEARCRKCHYEGTFNKK